MKTIKPPIKKILFKTEQEFLNCIEVDKVCPYIEDMIAQNKPFIAILRLICLQSITSSGLKPKILDHYKRELVQVYGLGALLAITKLEKAGLIKPQSGTRQYTVLRKALRLTMEDTSEINPTDISYVHSVYAPLSVRLAEQVTKNGGWKQLQDVLGLLPGNSFFCVFMLVIPVFLKGLHWMKQFQYQIVLPPTAPKLY